MCGGKIGGASCLYVFRIRCWSINYIIWIVWWLESTLPSRRTSQWEYIRCTVLSQTLVWSIASVKNARKNRFDARNVWQMLERNCWQETRLCSQTQTHIFGCSISIQSINYSHNTLWASNVRILKNDDFQRVCCTADDPSLADRGWCCDPPRLVFSEARYADEGLPCKCKSLVRDK